VGIWIRSTHREKGVVFAHETKDVLGRSGTGCHRRGSPGLYGYDKRANDSFRTDQDGNGTKGEESVEEGTGQYRTYCRKVLRRTTVGADT
jgi:hypothetical protein